MKNKKEPGKQLYLKPEEAKFLGMAVVAMVEHLKDSGTDETIPWNPETRKTIGDMLTAGKGLKIKLEGMGFDMRPLPDYVKGEEKDYFTKES